MQSTLENADYKPRLEFDGSKPEGPFSRALDISLAKKLLGWEPKVDLGELCTMPQSPEFSSFPETVPL